MRIGLHDAEKEYMKRKTFPNYALMKISAYHKARGDFVEWWSPMFHYGRCYLKESWAEYLTRHKEKRLQECNS